MRPCRRAQAGACWPAVRRPAARVLAVLVSGLLLSASLGAQTHVGAAPPETPLARARRLVSEGQGTEGRRIVDSVLVATAPSAPAYADALFWRAALATTAVEAERDYLRIASEFPLTGRAEDALIRLAQLEMARGARAAAMRHLERLVLEHPAGAARPRASYWMARILFEQNEVPRACTALAMARARAADTDVELKHQIEFLTGRCAGVAPGASDTAVPKPSASTAVAPRPVPAVPAPVASPRASPAFSVQVGAFDQRAPAASLVARLRERGHDARVVGERAPFRVRIGRFANRAEAVTLAARFKRQGSEAWVVAAEPR